MKPVDIIVVLSAAINMSIGLFTFFRNRSSKKNLYLSLFVFSIAGWSLTLVALVNTGLIFWGRSTFFFTSLAYFFYISFLYNLLKSHIQINRLMNKAFLFISLLFSAISYTNLIEDRVVKKYGSVYGGADIILGKGYYYIAVFYLIAFIYVFYLMVLGYKASRGLFRLQTKYLFFGLVSFAIPALVTNLILPSFGIFQFNGLGPAFSVIMIMTMSYSIIKYRLMNIRFIVGRSVLYFLLISLIGSVFVFSAFITSSVFIVDSKLGILGINFLTSLIVVFLFDPLRKLLSRLTDDIFYKGKIEYEQVLEKISRILAQEIDLELLLNKVKQGIETEVKIKKVDVWVKMSDKFYSFSEKSPVEGTFEPEFISYLQKENNLIVTEELKRQLYDLPEGAARSQLEKMASIIDRLHWEMAIPVTDKGEVTAILGLHHKLSGDIYTGEEINFFGIVASQLAVAIEKSKYYEEVQQAREDLQVKVDRATLRLRQNNIDLEARNKFLTTTQNISNLISRSLEIKNIIQVIADSISSELGYIGGILSFADAEKKFLYAAAITRSEAGMKALSMLPRPANEYKSSVKNKDNLGVKIFISGQAMTGPKLSDFLSPPVEKDVMDKIQLALGVQTVVGVPIYAENEIIGVIDYLLAVPEAQISKLDMEMMNNLADQIGIVYRNVKLYQELEGANKELQQANFHLMQLDKAKSEFLSIASHQLRTPVSAIKGYLSMMIEGDFGVVKPEQKKIITDVFESASRLARTINVFLNVSRIEAGRFKLTKAPIDMNTVTEGVIKELKQQAAIKNVKLEWLPPAKPCTIIVDGDKVREVVLNLVDNSIKYTQEGFVRVTQDMTPTEFHFQVTDSGMGILPEEVGTLFKKFVRGTGVAQVNTSGSGLGLYIAQRVVKEHGGKIWVESPGVGKGSTFQFTIPIETVISDKVQSKEMIESTDAKLPTESKEKK